MTIKTVLTVTSPDLGEADLKLAATLCEEIEAHLAVLIVALAAPPPIGEYAAVVSDIWLQERQADLAKLKERSDAVSTWLASSRVSTDISSEYQEITWSDEAIGRRARYADITLLGPDMLSHDTLKEKVVEGALFHSGKPLLLIPDGATATLKPKRIMVAWDSRVEASQAVAQSLDLLTVAEEVRLVLVDPTEGEDAHGAEPGADMATFLARHGVKVTVDRLPSQGKAVASVLRQHAADMAAELLVMGAYGHSRLRQKIFGGVTSSMLGEPPIPILMAR
ncbi:universal stress protein [Pseudaminobacter arsenicus]|uniref:Universal stress protein n=1 Tax=Borborobacter arsenicus TaxID=1851146 RepID=A0A432V198_9HYPH|nr:universal stress protein [Pseudaminobacter arsenicus]RUM95963.1 universal stress protein [Pseudaminobacter arsenicus]